MPFSVRDLIVGLREPIVAEPSEPVNMALERMIQYDFSQLPVVNHERKPVGMLTSDSILRASSHFGVTIESLSVRDAMQAARLFRDDEELFTLLSGLRDVYAVLIVDGEGQLRGIVTNFDAAEFFRQRAEDMMYVEDIETLLRDYILLAFQDGASALQEKALAKAIEEITPSGEGLRTQFISALKHYANLAKFKIDEATLQTVLEKHYSLTVEPKEFKELTLYEFTELFLHPSRWSQYAAAFSQEPTAIRRLLDGVRRVRNKLAHFGGELTAQERERLQYCARWLVAHDESLKSQFATRGPRAMTVETIEGSSSVPRPSLDEGSARSRGEQSPVEEEITSSDSRYAPLGIFLQERAESEPVQMRFSEVEKILGAPLPDTARRHRAWWANDSVSHVQSQQWLEAGWRVSGVSLSSESVTFSRIAEREKAYIDFFSQLWQEFGPQAEFELMENITQGRHYLRTTSVPEQGPKRASFTFSFSHRQRFRVELYIFADTPEKAIFDALYAEKESLEKAFGAPIRWERLDGKGASRIAVYHKGAITDDADTLTALRAWAIPTMNRLYTVVVPAFEEAVRKIDV